MIPIVTSPYSGWQKHIKESRWTKFLKEAANNKGGALVSYKDSNEKFPASERRPITAIALASIRRTFATENGSVPRTGFSGGWGLEADQLAPNSRPIVAGNCYGVIVVSCTGGLAMYGSSFYRWIYTK